ncbi:MAG: cupin domain-containing protein [bacterium]
MNHDKIKQLCAAYALGALDEADRLVVEEHLQENCPSCMKILAEFGVVVGGLGLTAAPVTPRPELKKKILHEAMHDVHEKTTDPDATKGKMPHHIIRANEGEWLPVREKITVKILFTDKERNQTTMLLRMAPGGVLPGHLHEGAEELFVLEGSCLAEGIKLNVGDYHRAESGSTHGETTTETGCLMLLISPKVEFLD